MAASSLVRLISNALYERSMRLYRSRVGWRVAPKYQRYWDLARRGFQGRLPTMPAELNAKVEEFSRAGVTCFWTEESRSVAQRMMERIKAAEAAGDSSKWQSDVGDSRNLNYLGDLWNDFPELRALFDSPDGPGPLACFLMNYFGCNYRIHYATLFKSLPTEGEPSGSQMWHSDAGPGSCVNLGFFLHDTDQHSGVTEILPWPESLEIYMGQFKATRTGLELLGKGAGKEKMRYVFNSYYESEIAAKHSGKVAKPYGAAGMVVPFLNNTLHRGGYPHPKFGKTRYAIVFHFYPSAEPIDYSVYDRQGIAKRSPYPKDPAQVGS
jgi:hypothetical protein